MKIFLWPSPKFSIIFFFKYLHINVELIENYLQKNYKNSFPIVVSSGRIAIKLAILYLNQKRKKKLKLFPYVSKCVRDVILDNIEINENNLNNEDIQIIYHHMSMIQEQKKSKYLIEDSVDTLLHFGEKLHRLNSQIEIWSIEKIYGSLGGGIIWCKNENIRNEIKKILKNNYKQKNYIWFIKIISSYFNIIKNISINLEKKNSYIPNWMAGQIYGKIIEHEKIYKNRYLKYKLIKDLLPKWYRLDKNRLPSTLPIENSEKIQQIAKKYKISTEVRHFELIKNKNFIKFFPIPIHEEMSLNNFTKFINEIKK